MTPWPHNRHAALVGPAIAFLLSKHDSTINNPSVEAIIARPLPFRDENGNQIFLRGDESFHWEEDEYGFTLIDDPFDTTNNTGQRRRVYADLDVKTGQLVSSGIVFGSSAPNNSTQRFLLNQIGKHVKPSPQARQLKCGRYCESGGFNKNNGRSDGTPLPYDNRRNHREHTNRRNLMSNTQSLKNLVVLIRFFDHKNRILPSPSDFEVLLNGPGGIGTVAPTGSVNDVFLANSYGTFSLNSTVVPWITVSGSEKYYADGKSGLGPILFEAIREAMDVIDADPTIDLQEFNTDYDNGDRFIDSITIFHSGYGAEWGGPDCYGTPMSQRIWSHNWFLYTGTWSSRDGKVKVSNYNINPGVWDICGSQLSRIGVVAHEASHFLGLPDLYDPSGGLGVGIYCLMSDSWGVDGSQLYPPMMCPWSKMYLGWLIPKVLDGTGDKTLRQSWEYPEVYILYAGYQSKEYLLIENRQPGSFDALLPRGGLAIWHVDESMALSSNTYEGYPGQLGWPANNRHYFVALLQADGRYDLEKGINSGDYLDLFRFDFYGGEDFLSPSYDDPMLGPFPNTDSYGKGVVARTNNFISGISAPGEEMTFSVLTASPCKPDEVHFDLLLLTDGKGSEVSWSLQMTSTYDIVLSGSGYASYKEINIVQCLPIQCYTFLITDSGGDGLCCDYGYGGYSVRLNGLKLASSNDYGNEDKVDLHCVMSPSSWIEPTNSPSTAPSSYSSTTQIPSAFPSNIPSSYPSITHEPSAFPSNSPSSHPSFSQVPSAFPSNMPSSYPSSSPSRAPSISPTKEVCTGEKGLLEVITEGDEFIDEVRWNVQDIFGNVLIESTVNYGGQQSTLKCIRSSACYTFTIHDSMGINLERSDNQRGMHTIKLDDATVFSGSNFGTDHHVMFGDSCLGNGNAACSVNNDLDDKSMFRLEFVGDNSGGDIAWKLIDSNDTILRDAGPFGDCNVNSLATCISRAGCYQFIATNNASSSLEPVGSFTVLFSETDDGIQNYTGYFSHGSSQVFLGSCYDMNFKEQ